METTINQRFKKLRQHLGLNQEQMAEVLVVTQSNVSAMEKETSIMPHHIDTLHKKYNENKLWLIDGKGEMFETVTSTEKPTENSWKEEAYAAMKSERDLLKSELNRVWAVVHHLTGSTKADFLKAIKEAGFLNYQLPGKRGSLIARA